MRRARASLDGACNGKRRAAHDMRPDSLRETMPLPTPPSKLGNLLPPDEYKTKARPAKQAKKQAIVGEQADAADYGSMSGPASVAQPMTPPANAATTLRPRQAHAAPA